MGKIIKAINSLDKKSQKSYLTSDMDVGDSAINWDNNSGFRASWAVQLGETGQERSEILTLGTATPGVSAGTATGTAKYSHPLDTPIYSILYDKYIFLRSTSGTSGTATALTDGTVDITPDSEYTTFYDDSGADSYAYRVQPYNSILDVTGVISDWLTSAGYDFYSLYKIRDRAKRKLHNRKAFDDDDVNDWINEWMEELNNTAIEVNKDYSIGTTEVAIGTSGLGTITDTDYIDIRKIEFTYDGSNYYVCSRMDVVDFNQSDSFLKTHPYFYFTGDNTFGIKPDNEVGTALITYYKNITLLSSDTDTLPVVMRPYSKSFVSYARAQAAYLDDDVNLGDRFMGMANADKEKFLKQITPRHNTGPKYINLVESIDGEGSHHNYYF